ncbi:hypothetical protein PtA15_8A99 [Puccinia triticina]|uniref:Histidine kinase/HSP90-like ATPase domain-containing protein n=1 Tax=Puccinia triticina TaxID=208348 RepID=A0ABY7CQI3_9BASI|nr:uncharacterized protein PtA15_8A99 [Puccinia triticina]WAQ87198.1 hypothetical protein PtA15_8A99 [Puccinia triticina]
MNLASANRILVAVTDAGQGIPEAQLENIFRAFEQVGSGESHDEVMCESIGLGLAIVGRVVHNMGGHGSGSMGTSSSGIDEIVDAITGESSGRNSFEAPYLPRLTSSFQNRNRSGPRKSLPRPLRFCLIASTPQPSPPFLCVPGTGNLYRIPQIPSAHPPAIPSTLPDISLHQQPRTPNPQESSIARRNHAHTKRHTPHRSACFPTDPWLGGARVRPSIPANGHPEQIQKGTTPQPSNTTHSWITQPVQQLSYNKPMETKDQRLDCTQSLALTQTPEFSQWAKALKSAGSDYEIQVTRSSADLSGAASQTVPKFSIALCPSRLACPRLSKGEYYELKGQVAVARSGTQNFLYAPKGHCWKRYTRASASPTPVKAHQSGQFLAKYRIDANLVSLGADVEFRAGIKIQMQGVLYSFSAAKAMATIDVHSGFIGRSPAFMNGHKKRIINLDN